MCERCNSISVTLQAPSLRDLEGTRALRHIFLLKYPPIEETIDWHCALFTLNKYLLQKLSSPVIKPS